MNVLLDWLLIAVAAWAVGWPLVLGMVAVGFVADLLWRLLRSPPPPPQPVAADALRGDPVF